MKIIDLIFTIFGFTTDLQEFFSIIYVDMKVDHVSDTIFSLIGGIAGLGVAAFAMLCVPLTKKVAFRILGIGMVFTGLILIAFGASQFNLATNEE